MAVRTSVWTFWWTEAAREGKKQRNMTTVGSEDIVGLEVGDMNRQGQKKIVGLEDGTQSHRFLGRTVRFLVIRNEDADVQEAQLRSLHELLILFTGSPSDQERTSKRDRQHPY